MPVETSMWIAKKSRSGAAGALLALLIGLGLTLAARGAEDTNSIASQLPDMGSPENALLSKTDEFQIGLMAMHDLRGQGLILEDPELSDYIQNLGSRLASQARDDDQNFQYFIIRSSEINAFATFGGFICVNSGLILLTNTESDLAAVLGHETAHVRQRHIARSILAQSRMSLGTTAAMLAAVLISAVSGAGGEAMEGAIAMGQSIALQQSMNFTRGEEAEADRIGIGLVAGAGFDASAMANFFEAMARRQGDPETPGPAGHAAQSPGHPRSYRRGARARGTVCEVPDQRIDPVSVDARAPARAGGPRRQGHGGLLRSAPRSPCT